MSSIILMIPTGGTGQNGSPAFVRGECRQQGYEGMILVDTVSWQGEIENETPHQRRRTTNLPKLSAVTIARRVDSASTVLTKWSLSVSISSQPWELYFFKSIGDRPGTSPSDSVSTRFMYLKMLLYRPLIQKCEFDFGEADSKETLEISPAAIEWTYYQTSATHNILGNVTLTYDVQSGQYT